MAQPFSAEKALDYYREMLRIRRFDLKAAELFSQGLMAGNIHTCVGQEAIAVGACQALQPQDLITSTHRGHGHCLAKGGQADRMMAELFGKERGYCKGKGGSMHIVDTTLGILGANGIVGAGIPIAVGSAFASAVQGRDEVTLAFFGDAASNQGMFHEAVNMASAWKLPVVLLCENNLYGVSVAIHRVCNIDHIAHRAAAYNIPGVIVDGNDVFAVYDAVTVAAVRARKGLGPTLIEAKTYRWRGHYEGDPQVYKPQAEADEWKKKDPIAKLRQMLLDHKPGLAEQLSSIEQAVEQEIEAAVLFAKQSPYPRAEQVSTDVYAMDNERSVAR